MQPPPNKKATPKPAGFRNARTKKKLMLTLGGELSGCLYPVLSITAVGNALGISKMAVSYIERQALAKVFLKMQRP